ncbi:MAG TPA: DUF1844 domain-containing protein [Trueperaceae bacterium]|nr:DUF1844 domain-containing protein [Trueperaceae bacterium]
MDNLERHEGTQAGARRSAAKGSRLPPGYRRARSALLTPTENQEAATSEVQRQAETEASVRFVGLIHALRASAEAAMGDDSSPLRLASRDGVAGRKAARRSLDLLEMLQVKTLGNLEPGERDALWSALRAVRERLQETAGELPVLDASSAGLLTDDQA